MEPINKPLTIRIAGWTAVTLWVIGWGDCLWGGFTIAHTPPLAAETAALFILFGFPPIILWFAGTTWFHIQKNKVIIRQRMLALEMEQQRRKGMMPNGPSIEDWAKQQNAAKR